MRALLLFLGLGMFHTSYAGTLESSLEWPAAYLKRGDAYMAQGQYSNAMTNYERAVEIFPKSVSARIGIGYALKELGRQDEAYQYFQEAVSIFPDAAEYDFVRRSFESPGDPEAYYGQGLVYLTHNRIEEAVISLKSAIALDPEHTDAHLQLGMAYLVLGEDELARGEYEVLKPLNEARAREMYQLLSE